MHPQTDCHFFSLPPEIRVVIQQEYLKHHTKIQAKYRLLPSAEGGEINSCRGISIAHPLMLTCVKMYKEMRPMAFQDFTILFALFRQPQLPLKVVLPPPRQYLQNLTLIADISQREMMEHQELALHLLESPSLEKFTITGLDTLHWFNVHDHCFFTGLRKPLERRRGQKVVQLPQEPYRSLRAQSISSISFTFE
ncbi:hypothetical protein CEP54_005824 [Fusarium duplospermum]|uniref:Uncharacterized protein n=1 Tax=Fusarium duplospermum TaxID=1325734 RepID=A0A428QA65_9HYPO|nr:hypothetical protein CEP54_005824 [Fusarium duplospermum]